MKNQFENFPNEIFLKIFSYLSWDELLLSFWSLNERMNSLICSILLIDHNGTIFNRSNLTSMKYFFELVPLIRNSPSLSSNIKSIHCDGNNAIQFDMIFQEIFYHNDQLQICFPNLKSLYITQCVLSQPFVQILSLLIQNQLNDLILSFHKDNYNILYRYEDSSSINSVRSKKKISLIRLS